jgi:hypothetical protein
MIVIVAAARTAEEESLIEAELIKAAIPHTISFDAVPDAPEGAACFLARTYGVEEEEASRARATLEMGGLADCVVGRPMCPACGHPENPHRLCGYGEPPTEGWMECPVEGCACSRTWSFAR